MSSSSDEMPSAVEQARQAIAEATQYAWNLLLPEGHWHGEINADIANTAQHIFFHQSLLAYRDNEKQVHNSAASIPDADLYRLYLLTHQRPDDGSWALATDLPGDLSTTCEVYLALKILGVPADDPRLRKAAAFVRAHGGLPGVRVLTRYQLAAFGLFPWDATQLLPVELILLPPSAPVSIYHLASWARSTTVPLLLTAHHRPIFALPNGRSPQNDFLDELWVDPSNKTIPGPLADSSWLAPILARLTRALGWSADALLRCNPLRPLARRRCVQWILERQEPTGDWAGITPPIHASLRALLLEGYGLDSPPVRLGIEALERFTWTDATGRTGKQLQSSVSPVWDTVLMVRGLCDASSAGPRILSTQDPRLQRALEWIASQQIRHPTSGDWRVARPGLAAGGWAFEYHNTWYPDVDDSAAALLALLQRDDVADHPSFSAAVVPAATWLGGMQSADGGWGGFDADNNHLWLNHLPFSDMNALCDPSTPDVTGRVLEAFGALLQATEERKSRRSSPLHPHLRASLLQSCQRSIAFLQAQQESFGGWFGRWGVNYLFGTCNVLCGLAHFARDDSRGWIDADTARVIKRMMAAGAAWLCSVQNSDGGWGESTLSYRHIELGGRGPSTPSQTSWALMALLAAGSSPSDSVVLAGIAWLLRNQTDRPQGPEGGMGASWPEPLYTATGFPNEYYIQYTLYRHYYPLMALGRFIRTAERAKTNQEQGKEATSS